MSKAGTNNFICDGIITEVVSGSKIVVKCEESPLDLGGKIKFTGDVAKNLAKLPVGTCVRFIINAYPSSS